MRLYDFLPSGNGYKVRLLLSQLGVRFSLVERDIHLGETRTPEWAREFDLGIARALERHEADHLVRALASETGRLSHPTPDHYLPLLYAAGASRNDDPVLYPIEGFDMASLSMRSVVFG